MYITSNENWIRYSSTGDWKLSNIKDGGKWMHYYNDRKFAKAMIEQALSTGIVEYAKHTKGKTGMVCYYVSGTDYDQHFRVLKFMLENNLIRLTSTLNYFDIGFKFNGQSWSKEFGPNFEGLIKLSNFINIETGEFLPPQDINTLLTLTSINKSAYLAQDYYLQPMIDALDKFIIDKVNKLFTYDQSNTDLNDKIIYLAPSGYNLSQLYTRRNSNSFLNIAAHCISYLVLTATDKDKQLLLKLDQRSTNELRQLISIISDSKLHIDDDNTIIKLDNRASTKFILSLNHTQLTADDSKIIAYYIFLSLQQINKKNIDYIIANHQVI